MNSERMAAERLGNKIKHLPPSLLAFISRLIFYSIFFSFSFFFYYVLTAIFDFFTLAYLLFACFSFDLLLFSLFFLFSFYCSTFSFLPYTSYKAHHCTSASLWNRNIFSRHLYTSTSFVFLNVFHEEEISRIPFVRPYSTPHSCKWKVKVTPWHSSAHKEGRWRYSSSNSQPSTKRSVVSTTLRPFRPRKRPGTPCRGRCVGLGSGLDGTEILTGIRSLDRPARCELLYRLRYPGRLTILVPIQFRARSWRLDV